MSEYKPDVWHVIKFSAEGFEPSVYKLLSGWSGGYTQGQSWRLNSGITKIFEEGDYYIIEGYSGSSYMCHKEMERFNTITATTFQYWKEQCANTTSVEIVPINEAIKQINR